MGTHHRDQPRSRHCAPGPLEGSVSGDSVLDHGVLSPWCAATHDQTVFPFEAASSTHVEGRTVRCCRLYTKGYRATSKTTTGSPGAPADPLKASSRRRRRHGSLAWTRGRAIAAGGAIAWMRCAALAALVVSGCAAGPASARPSAVAPEPLPAHAAMVLLEVAESGALIMDRSPVDDGRLTEWLLRRRSYCVDHDTGMVIAIAVLDASSSCCWDTVEAAIARVARIGFWRVFLLARPYDIFAVSVGDYGLHITLPVAGEQEEQEEEADVRVSVVVGRERDRVLIGDEEPRTDYAMERSVRHVRARRVRLTVDRRARYGTVVAVVDLLYRHECGHIDIVSSVTDDLIRAEPFHLR